MSPYMLVIALLPLLAGAQSRHHKRLTLRFTIENVAQREFLFASGSKLDHQRRHALTWIPGFDASKDTSGQWDVTFLPNGRVTIENVKFREFLYVGSNKLDSQRRRALTWIPGFDASRDPTGQWELRSVSPNVVTLKSVAHREFLFAGARKLDLMRRYALSWIPGFDASKDTTGQWRLRTVNLLHGSAAAELMNGSADLPAEVDEAPANQTEIAAPANQTESLIFP